MYRIWLLFPVWLAGCAGLIPENTNATLAAQNRAYVTEAAQLRSTMAAAEVQVASTSIAAETQVAVENDINSMLLSTVRAGDPPTVQVRVQLDRSVSRQLGETTPAPGGSVVDTPSGEVVTTYTTSEIQQTDGCGADRQNQFELGVFRIFAVQEVRNIAAGTLVGVEWYYNNNVAFEDQLRVTEAADNLCVWFFVEPYSAGDWSVQFTSNGTPVGSRANFQVVE